jgi:hypothetical protein
MASRLVKMDAELRQAAEKALLELVRIEHEFDRSCIILPIWLDSGSAVSVSIMRDRHGFMVSDAGDTYREAEDIGAQNSFSKQARKFSAQLGLLYADKQICLHDVSGENLAGAISIIAEAAKISYDAAAARAAEARDKKLGEVFYEKLVRVFDSRNVAKEASIRGASNHEWHFSNVVTFQEHRTIFEPVSPAPNSVFSVFSKFQDVRQLTNAPSRISVVSNREEMGDYVSLLAQASNVIESEASDITLRQLVA